jgi:hypothetical protein
MLSGPAAESANLRMDVGLLAHPDAEALQFFNSICRLTLDVAREQERVLRRHRLAAQSDECKTVSVQVGMRWTRLCLAWLA